MEAPVPGDTVPTDTRVLGRSLVSIMAFFCHTYCSGDRFWLVFHPNSLLWQELIFKNKETKPSCL